MATTTRPPVESALRRARIGVATLFAANAVVFASLVPWYPTIKAELDLSNTSFGIAVAGFPFGALVLGALSGPMIARWGSARTATSFGLATTVMLPIVGLAPSWGLFIATMVLLGASDAITDTAMNAHGLRVQRRYGRSIINSFHALWSSGAVAGGLIGSLVVGLEVPRTAHLVVVAAVTFAGLVVTGRWLLSGPEHTERPHEETTGRGTGLRGAVRVAPGLLLGLGMLLMTSVAIEDIAATWSGVYLLTVVLAPAGAVGLGFVANQGLMIVGRTTGDRLVDRFGARRVAGAGMLLSAAGVAAVVMSSSLAVVLAGFAVAGFGNATVFPLAMAAAGDAPGVRSGDAVTIVSLLARVGFLAMPPIIGVLADAVSLRSALAMVVATTLAGAWLTRLLVPTSPDP